MENPIFDGECHAVPDSKEYGYIAARIDSLSQFNDELKQLQRNVDMQLRKYSEYLVNHDKEKSIELLTDIFRSQVICGYTPEDYKIIHRPPWIVSALAQYGTLVIKFKRSKKDNLDEVPQGCSRCC